MKTLNIFDLDGTIFNDAWRLQYIDKENKNYDGYHERLTHDDHFPNIASQVGWSLSEGAVEFWTARPNKWRATTTKKLEDTFGYIPGVIIRMRGDDDLRSAAALKADYMRRLPSGYDQVYVYDDRADVLDAMIIEARPKTGVTFRFYLCTNGSFTEYHTLFNRSNKAKVPTTQDTLGDSLEATKPATAADILDAMAATFRERNAVYGDNAVMVGQVMQVLFPNGVTLKTPEDYHMWHLFELKIVKLTRFAISGLKHEDSIHDDGVYSAMCERLVNTHNINFNK